jgi:hypothetical protein
MSLKPSIIDPIPKDTVRVAHAAFPKGNLYLKMRDEFGTLFEDADFTALYPKRGQPAFSPWRLALVTIMPFLEELSDRQTLPPAFPAEKFQLSNVEEMPFPDERFDAVSRRGFISLPKGNLTPYSRDVTGLEKGSLGFATLSKKTSSRASPLRDFR